MVTPLMFSQTTEYALRVIVYLASRDGEPSTNKQIAAATLVPSGYLAKILQTLSRGGLVRSQRGLHGGSILVRDPVKLSLYDVVKVVDPLRRIETCPLALNWHGAQLCPLHHRLDEAIGEVEKTLRSATIATLLAGRNDRRPLCPNPSAAKATR